MKYFIGNISEHIEALKAEVVVIDLLASRMQALAVAGLESEVVAACALTRESPFTTIIVEQAHASGAQPMHRHPQLESASLVLSYDSAHLQNPLSPQHV